MYKIGVGAPLTDGAVALGKGMVRGTELAVKKANESAEAKAAGITFEVIQGDDKGDPTTGGNVARQIALRAGLHAPGAKLAITRIVSVNPALDPPSTVEAIDRHPLYRRVFLRRWRRSLLRKQKLFPHLYDFRGAKLIPTFHPSFLLRSPGYKREGTSKLAADEIAREASELQSRCLEVIKLRPSTSDEVASALNRSVLAIRPRVSVFTPVAVVKELMVSSRFSIVFSNTSG